MKPFLIAISTKNSCYSPEAKALMLDTCTLKLNDDNILSTKVNCTDPLVLSSILYSDSLKFKTATTYVYIQKV